MQAKILTNAQFSTKLAKNVTTGKNHREDFNNLVLDAAHFALGAGDYMGFKAAAADSLGSCRGDITRLQAVIDASEEIKHINTTALKLWMKTFLPVMFDKVNDNKVQWNKKVAGKQTYADIAQAIEDMAATPFWEFRKDVESTAKLFDLGKSVEQLLIKAMANGATLESITAALQVAAESEEVMKKVQAAKDKLVPSLPAAVAEAGAIIAAIDAE